MRNVIGATISCRRCKCRGIYSGKLDVNHTNECAECRHPLVGDHTLVLNGATDPALQFRFIESN
jgi:hypothetical protein